MAKLISLFNHKGGVSKTTTAFNLGWMLAEKGKRILLVDCDPQCNLTGMFYGLSGVEDLEGVYNSGGVRNIRDGLSPAFESKPAPIVPVVCDAMAGQPNLYILPGHIGLAEYETTLGIAQELSGSLPTLQNLPGAIHALIEITAAEYDIDLVLIDMSPSLGPVNQNLISISNYFVVPMAPDYFSAMAIDSLSTVLPRWKAWAVKANNQKILKDATYPLPICDPKFLGTVIQKYRLREGNTPSAAFQKWINTISSKIAVTLLPSLADAKMLLDLHQYDAACAPLDKPLMQMSDFNGLIALSQKHSAPVFALTDVQLEQTGIVLDRTKASMKQFADIFAEGADRIIALAV